MITPHSERKFESLKKPTTQQHSSLAAYVARGITGIIRIIHAVRNAMYKIFLCLSTKLINLGRVRRL